MRELKLFILVLAGIACAYGQTAIPVAITAAQGSNGHAQWTATNTGTLPSQL